jgi:CubicO group peptidase (beta-lactamase class C family)
MRLTATPLHPDLAGVPSVRRAEPEPKWADAAAHGGRIARSSLVEQNLPGLSVAVGVDGEVVWAEGFGWADLANREPVTPETRFRIGTASIVLTSAAVGVLMEQDRLKLDDVIQTYVPEFPEKQWPVTLRQLMGHLAGVRTDGGDEGPLYSQHCQRPVDALPCFSERPLLFEPGTDFRYSSYGWILVSAAVEAAANQPFLAFMQQEIFEPLGMVDTTADSAITARGDRATSYFPRFAADPRYGPHLMRDIDLSGYAGAGSLVTTPTDLVRFGMAMNRGKLLQPATVQVLQAPQRLNSGTETGYGLGWDRQTVTLAGEPTSSVGHDGELLGGMAASLLTFPEQGIVVSVTANISYADTPAIALKIAQAFAEQRDRATSRDPGQEN